ncbi:MAG: Opr family porin [Campylobacteraceae bacterium]|nr:Opr family porin [Campylobacteraceae bacterium]
MKLKKGTALVLLATTALLAKSSSIQEALIEGKWGGDAYMYNRYTDCYNDDGYCNYVNRDNKASGYGQGSFNLYYSSDQFYGFNFSLGARFNYQIWEKTKNDFHQNTDILLHTANIGYGSEYFDAMVGFQEADFEWVSDYHQAAVAVVKPLSSFAVTLAYVREKGEAAGDDPLVKFHKFNGDKGGFIIDAKYASDFGLDINPFYYDVPDITSWYGARVAYETKINDKTFVGGNVVYTASSEDTNNKNGAIGFAELQGGYEGFDMRLGLIKIDKNGIGSINMLGDSIDPFWNGDIVYEPDVSTVYLKGAYAFDAWSISALIGKSKGDGLPDVQEFNLIGGYKFDNVFNSIDDSLKISLVFVNSNVDNETPYIRDHSKYACYFIYSFKNR